MVLLLAVFYVGLIASYPQLMESLPTAKCIVA